MVALFARVCVVVALALVCSGKAAATPGAPITAFRDFCFASPEAQRYFVTLLKESKIAFGINKKGCATFNSVQQDRLRKIISKVVRRYYPGNSVYYPNSRYSDMLKSLLEKHHIPYGTFTRNGKEYISWAKQYAPQVQALMERVDAQQNEDVLKALESGRRPRR